MNKKQHISELVATLKAKGIAGVVLAPGSRNAPLTQVFYRELPEMCVNLVDERSAGYFALGIAMKQQMPAVVCTTSGTAVLNLAPAVAEAYHQHIPLIVLTADRPKEWLGQHDNQTINQTAIFGSNCKGSFELPVQMQSTDDLWYANRIINEAYNLAIAGTPGPVHINIPLKEPLYEKLPIAQEVRTISTISSEAFIFPKTLKLDWKEYENVMVVCGQMSPDNRLEILLNKFSEKTRIPVLAESIANIKGETIIQNADLILTQSDAPEVPQLVIYFGGQVVSKRLKLYLRSSKNTVVWYISEDGQHIDTFQHLTHVINCSPACFFEAFLKEDFEEKNNNYQKSWLKYKHRILEKIGGLKPKISYSDLWAHAQISESLTKDDILFAGNSSVVRYLQFFKSDIKNIYSNRGTSGIDGCVSTAAGIASQTNKKVLVVVGDLSFMYDSNGLWNRNLPENLKVVVINNGGGSIFGMISGPSEQPSYKDFFEANHPVLLDKVAEAFQVEYFISIRKESFVDLYKQFYSSSKAALLEIVTNNEDNASVFHNFIENIRSNE